MSKQICILLLGLVVVATGHKASSSCAHLCGTDSPIICSGPCDVDALVISRLYNDYGRDLVDTCLTPCECKNHEFAYQSDKLCEVIQSLAIAKDCKCGAVWKKNLAKWKISQPIEFARKDVVEYLANRSGARKLQNLLFKADRTTTNPWENWCKHQCAEGLGGSACYCDIIP